MVTQKDTNSTTGSINGSINGSNTNTSTGPINGSIQPGSALAAIGSQGASLKQGLFIFVLVLCAFFSALWVAFAPGMFESIFSDIVGSLIFIALYAHTQICFF